MCTESERCVRTDRTGERFFHHCWPWWGVLIAYIIGASTTSIGARYFAMFLMAAGYSGALTVPFFFSMYSFLIRVRSDRRVGSECDTTPSRETLGRNWNGQWNRQYW